MLRLPWAGKLCGMLFVVTFDLIFFYYAAIGVFTVYLSISFFISVKPSAGTEINSGLANRVSNFFK